MAFNYSPKIVTDGLVLYLDAANPKSIPNDPTVNLITTNPTPINNLTGYDYAYGAPTASYNATSQSVEITTTNSPVGWLVNNNSLNSTVLSTGSLYTISFEWKPESDSTSLCRIWPQIATGNNLTSSYTGVMRNSGSLTVTSQNTLLSNGWYLFSQTFTPTHPGVNGDRSFRLLGGGVSGGEKLHIHWRNLQLECTPYRTPFVSGSYQTWFDLSRNNSAATLASSSIAGSIPTFPSASNRVLRFDGTSSYARVDSNILQDSGGTINMWVYPIGTSAGYILAAFGTNSDRFYIYRFDGAFSFTRGNPGVSHGKGSSPSGVWYNVALTWDSSSFSSYVNGIYNTSSIYAASGSTSLFTIGAYTSPLGSQGFNGNIGFTQIYNRALSQAEITQNYNATKTRFGLT
jgi:hypothetical protein